MAFSRCPATLAASVPRMALSRRSDAAGGPRKCPGLGPDWLDWQVVSGGKKVVSSGLYCWWLILNEWMCNTAREIGAATQPLSHSARVAGPATQPLWQSGWTSHSYQSVWVAEWLAVAEWLEQPLSHSATLAERLDQPLWQNVSVGE